MASSFGDVDTWIGRVLDERYEILEFVGDGATAVVYRGLHLDLAKPVAIKLLHGTLSTPEQREIDERRFLREAVFLGRVSHPHVCQALDFGIADGIRYLVMEFVTGPSLFQVLEDAGKLSWERVASIGFEIADGLTAIHAGGLVHRDLKPENITLVAVDGSGNSEPEFVKILDFGLAKVVDEKTTQERLTIDGSVCGTPHYMAPEQAVDEDVGPAADLYSLGVLLFELAAGRLPFDYDSMFLLMQAHVQEEPPDLREFTPEAPGWLAELIMRLMAKDPADRPASAAEVQDEISQALVSGDSGRAMSGRQLRALARRREKRKKPRAAATWLIAFMLFAVLALAGLLVWQQQQSDDADATPKVVVTPNTAPGDVKPSKTAAAEPEAARRTEAAKPENQKATLVQDRAKFAARQDLQQVMARRASDANFAATTLQQLLVKEPKNAHAHYFLALSLVTLERPIDALDAFGKALTLDPRHRGDKALLDAIFGFIDQPVNKDTRPAAEKLIKTHKLLAAGRKYLEAMAGDPTRPEAALVAKRLLGDLAKAEDTPP